MSIKEIAQEPGFSDMSSFSQAYARWTGVAPNVSRQETAAS
ncbi:helix-turn-helix domain-containing protein [Burkholderia cepacia]|nr:helix-turn-helix domain-containing protein [Burkholderia cepacia]